MRKQGFGGGFVYLLITAGAFLFLQPTALAENSAGPRSEFSGIADYYHHALYGNKTASGEVLKKDRLTAAHRKLPFGTRVKVVNKRSGRSCIVVINDRGPFTRSKVIDLSHAAAKAIGILESGTGLVACTVLGQSDSE